MREYDCGLVGGPRLRAGGNAGQRGDLVVEADGVVERVLPTLVPRLVEGILHRRQLDAEWCGQRAQLAEWRAGELAFAVGELRLDVANGLHRVVRLRRAVAHAGEEGELRGEVGGGGRGARILPEREPLRRDQCAVHQHAHLVGARGRHRALRAGGPHDEAIEGGCVGIPHVPVEAVDPRLVRHAGRGGRAHRAILVVAASLCGVVRHRLGAPAHHPLGAVGGDAGAAQGVDARLHPCRARHGIRGGGGILAAGEGANQRAVAIEELEPHFAACTVEPVAHHRAAAGAGGHRVHGRSGVRRGARATATTAREAHAVRVARTEQMGLGAGDRGTELPQRRDVVDHPEAATVRGGDQVTVAHGEVVHGHHRQVELEPLPVEAIVGREPDAALRAGVQHPRLLVILTDDARELGWCDAGVDARPRAAEVRGLPEIRSHVVELVPVGGNVRRARREVAGLDARHAAVDRHVRRGDLLPARAIVAREVHQPVVGTGPQHSLLLRRLGEGEDRPVVLHRRLVPGDRAAGGAEGFGVVAREIGRDHLPALPVVDRAMHVVARGVHHVGVVRRHDDREGPLEPIPEIDCRVAHRVVGVRIDVAREAGAHVLARDQRAVAAGVGDVRIVGAHGDVAGLATTRFHPVAGVDTARLAARSAERAVVLLRTADAIGKVVRRDDVIELRRGKVLGAPALAAVGGDARATVVPFDHPPVVVRGDPQVVGVTVRDAAHGGEAPAAVGGLEEVDVVHVHDVGVFRVGVDLGVVPGALAQGAVTVDPLPCDPRIAGPVDPARVGLDEGEDALRIQRRDSHGDVAEDAGGQAGAAGDVLPAVAAVGALEDAAARPAGDEHPWRASRLPEGGIEHVGVVRVHGEIAHAGGVVAEEDLRPVAAPVPGAIHTAIRCRRPDVSLCGDVDDVRVGGMHAHARDLPREVQAE